MVSVVLVSSLSLSVSLGKDDSDDNDCRYWEDDDTEEVEVDDTEEFEEEDEELRIRNLAIVTVFRFNENPN